MARSRYILNVETTAKTEPIVALRKALKLLKRFGLICTAAKESQQKSATLDDTQSVTESDHLEAVIDD